MNQRLVIEACLEDAGALLKPFYRARWSRDNPTCGYCYVVSEALYHFRYPELKPYVINLGVRGTHWFLAESRLAANQGRVVDFTAGQFADFDLGAAYRQAKGCGFFKGGVKTRHGWISKGGNRMAALLGLD